MERNRWIIATATFRLITATLLTVWSPTTSGQAPNRTAVATWEYRNVFGTVRQDNADELNRFGKKAGNCGAVRTMATACYASCSNAPPKSDV